MFQWINYVFSVFVSVFISLLGKLGGFQAILLYAP